MAKPHALGRQLAVLGLVSVAILAVVIATASHLSQRWTDADILVRAETDAFQRLKSIRRRMLRSIRATTEPETDRVRKSGRQLVPMLAATAEEHEAFVYAMMVSRNGVIIGHSDTAQINQRLPDGIRRQLAVSGGQDRATSELDAWFGDDRLLNYALPVTLDGARVATAHIGVSLPALLEYESEQRRAANSVLWLTALVCLLVLATGGVVGWGLIARARRRDEADARRDHLAEVGKLAGGLVHEIRNPLNAMRMQIAVMRGKLKRLHGEDVEAASNQLSCLESEVLRLQNLATNFLTYGRPPTDKLQEFNAVEVLHDVAEFLRSEFEQPGMHIDLEIDPGLEDATIVMDRGKLRQVLLNLAENARHAMSEGGTLTLSLARDSDGWLRFTVADTGCGIPRERLAHIFNAFFSTKDDGNGLGLSIVKRIVESTGGTISVESEVDRGTCFTIRFPTATRTKRPEVATVAHVKGGEAMA